ncbi:MAG: excinuclease ABC subunit UvrA [Acidobacteriota bacterium]
MHEIVVRGARQHNLKNLSLAIPHHRLIVVTGLSGSGKSSLAFDTLFAEGQRRYIESLSSYARQFMEQLEKPDVDSIEGLYPTVSISQKTISHSPRSTVGTVTEIYDYLRLLYARVGQSHCPRCRRAVRSQSLAKVRERILAQPEGTPTTIYAPVARGKKGTFQKEFQTWARMGLVRARVDGRIVDLGVAGPLRLRHKHDIDLLLDTLAARKENAQRVDEALELAARLSAGQVLIRAGKDEQLISTRMACLHCGISLPELHPRNFSFNSPFGACPNCRGLGVEHSVLYDEEDLTTPHVARRPCPACDGGRLRPESLAVTLGGMNIHDLVRSPIERAHGTLAGLELDERQHAIGDRLIREIRERMEFMLHLGLSYLTLDRPARSLAGGEAQRIRLASQIGSHLTGVLYVLDEPSIGLHQRDNRSLLEWLCELRDRGNTVIVVEHDEETIRSADWVIDLGPGAGRSGGYLICEGAPAEVAAKADSLTGAYLRREKTIPVPAERRRGNGRAITVRHASEHNLKDITVRFPLGLFVAVTGVSGSGKSTLVNEILYRVLARKLYRAKEAPGAHRSVEGASNIDKVVEIDQSPIGRTPRSNPATYTGLFAILRNFFSMLPESKIRGYAPGRFSFNVKGGRCEACRGDGQKKIEMNFLPDVYVTCDLCGGRRYNRETLEVRFRGKSIADYLEMTVDEAVSYLGSIHPMRRKLATLQEVGLGYITLGQSAVTLSGGEAQRIKLAKELSRKDTGKTLYILDEPTTGLHFEDVRRLIELLLRLVDLGNTVIVIEHHMDVIKCADHVIDLGPEGGDEGGWIVAEGTPEAVARAVTSATGRFLAQVLRASRS